jgi:PAS domain S-box-containing protein
MITGQSTSFEEYFPPLDRWFDVRAYPTPEELVVYVHDVTAERAQREQLQLLEAAVSRLNDMVMITEADPLDEPGPRIIYVNDAFEKRTGYRRDEVIGRTPRILQGLGTDRAELDRIRVALEAREPVRAELVNYTRDGRAFRVEVEIVPILDRSGRATHFVSVQRDVTEQRELEEKLRRSQRLDAIGQLTGGVAHDFNNLLTVILGNADLLAEELGGDERLRTLALMSRTAAERGAELTRRLLAFARRQALDPNITDVNELLAGMYGLLCRTLGEHIEIVLIQGDGLWQAMVDGPQLESAVLNLCINARDAMPDGGRLTLETGNARLGEGDRLHEGEVTPGEFVSISVSDTGIGMPADIVEHAFEPFFTTKETGKGSGLGLSMVYGFIKQSAGHVKIRSEPGEGTSVTLYLPRAVEPSGESSGNGPDAELVGGSERILLVEDDDIVRSFVCGELEELGYTVVGVADGPRAMRALQREGEFDLLFTDVIMPGGMNGRELAEAARALRPDLPVLFTSGYTEDALVDHGRLEGGVHLLHKPYRRAELAAKIRQVLTRRKP